MIENLKEFLGYLESKKIIQTHQLENEDKVKDLM